MSRLDRYSSIVPDWEECFPLLGEFCPAVAEALLKEHDYCENYTDQRVGELPVESTMPVRRALSAYVQRLYGLTMDDFNYEKLNLYLTLIHKVFIKKLVTTIVLCGLRKLVLCALHRLWAVAFSVAVRAKERRKISNFSKVKKTKNTKNIMS